MGDCILQQFRYYLIAIFDDVCEFSFFNYFISIIIILIVIFDDVFEIIIFNCFIILLICYF